MKYGIDLGTTNSAICRMENGEPIIKKTDTLKDTLPSCVSFTRKKIIKVGDSAYNDLRMDKARNTKTLDKQKNENVFVEFKRTMGLDKVYYSSNMQQGYTSEQLSAEILKALKTFITDDQVDAAVITIPAKFKADQIAATKRAATLAGIRYSELLQEPIAAAMAYGLSSEQKSGKFVVFDFGGGTFDVALLVVEDGIMQVLDTEGDNYLGGKNLDYAIVDEILIPYLQENFTIDSILNNETKRNILRDAVKYYAEQIKNQLSFNLKADVTSQLDEFGEDDDGEPIELDLVVTQDELKIVLTPIFQKAIDITKHLINRNSLVSSDISNLILVGGPTFSPILRSMLKEQITENINTSIDPMTAVATGAALYASGQSYDSDKNLEQGTIALDVTFPSSTVNDTEYISVKTLPKESKGNIPSTLFVEITRDGWSSGKISIDEIGDVIECQLRKGRANGFTIKTYNDRGDIIPCFPKEFTIMQGMVVGEAVLPFNIGVEAYSDEKEKDLFVPIPGLEKNKPIPAIGQKYDFFKVPKDLHPGNEQDRLIIPIYQGNYGMEGTSATFNDHVTDIIITGEDIPSFVPADSGINLTVKVDASQMMHIEIEFAAIHETIDKDLNITARSGVNEDQLNTAIKQANEMFESLDKAGLATENEIAECKKLLNDIDNRFDGEKSSEDGKMHLLASVQELCLKMETLNNKYEWDSLEASLYYELNKLESANQELGNQYDSEVYALKRQVNQVIRQKDITTARTTLTDIRNIFIGVTLIYQLIALIRQTNNDFTSIKWNNPQLALELISKGMDIINNGQPTTENLQPIVVGIFDCMDKAESEKLKF